MPRKKIDEKTKQDVILAYENGISRREIAERFGISLSSVGRIIKEKVPKQSPEKKNAPDTKTARQKKIEDLERRIAELERAVLEFEAKKKAHCRP